MQINLHVLILTKDKTALIFDEHFQLQQTLWNISFKCYTNPFVFYHNLITSKDRVIEDVIKSLNIICR